MKKISAAILTMLTLGLGFGGGFWYTHWRAANPAPKNGRKILYWVDPMHPAYKSDKPGIAPDCGMKLEPVYEDGRLPSAPSGKILYYRDPSGAPYFSVTPKKNAQGRDYIAVRAVEAGAPPGSARGSGSR